MQAFCFILQIQCKKNIVLNENKNKKMIKIEMSQGTERAV